MKVMINTFAVLKEHFDQSFEIDMYNLKTVNELKEELCRIKPGAKDILNISRFAVNNSFVTDKARIYENDYIFIIPPSSGG